MLIMIKWKLNVILFILLKGNSYIVCIRIFLLWTYRYRGFKIFERYRQPTLEKYVAVTILRGCKLWSNNIRVRINYYCWSLWGAEGLGLPVFNQLYVGLPHTVSMYKYQQPVSLENSMIWVNSKSFFCIIIPYKCNLSI